MKSLCVGLALLLMSQLSGCANAFNITKILAEHPQYSEFNHYLTQTKLADDINSRTTITVLVVSNGAMQSLKGLELETIKRSLSLHVLLDYFDSKMLHHINNRTTLTTTLYQTTGLAPGDFGSINITDIKGKKIGFGLAAEGSKLEALFVKKVMKDGFNISVVEVSQPIATVVAAAAPIQAPNEIDLSAILKKGGCSVFADMISSTGVVRSYVDAIYSGLTVFAPTDAAFAGVNSKLKNMSSEDKVSLLEFHALPTYSPHATLKIRKGRIATMASTRAGKYEIEVSSSGDSVTLQTGINKATVTNTLLDDVPLAIFKLDNVLKPKELFTVAPTPAPASAPEAEATSDSLSPSSDASKDSSTSFSPAATGVCHGFLVFLVGCAGVLLF